MLGLTLSFTLSSAGPAFCLRRNPFLCGFIFQRPVLCLSFKVFAFLSQVNEILSRSSVWSAFKDQKHDLFISDSQTAGYLTGNHFYLSYPKTCQKSLDLPFTQVHGKQHLEYFPRPLAPSPGNPGVLQTFSVAWDSLCAAHARQ